MAKEDDSAEAAYQQALALIEETRKAGETRISFGAARYRALDRIPPEIAGIEGLVSLDLHNTSVHDLTPIRGLAKLQILRLERTEISDLTELAGLTGLQRLHLNETGVSDLTALTGLTGLRVLTLSQTEVSDLTALADLTGLLSLSLDRTAVSDLTALAGLKGLLSLWLYNTRVHDLTPIRGLTGLQTLILDQTRVSDLTALAGLAGLQTLSLKQTKVRVLTALSGLRRLEILSLDQTAVTDLTALADLTGLLSLSLDQTGVSDLTVLAGLARLQILSVNQTGVSDLTALAGLTGLRTLSLSRTGVRDLRPLWQMTKLGEGRAGGLWFADTAAVRLDSTLARLAGIEDDEQRARDTVAYLNTLPPWPEPLPWLVQEDAGKDKDVPIDIPYGQPAPLQVIVENGVLKPWQSGDGLDDQGRHLARQGWAALRDYLADLADIRPRIANQIPTLDRALARLETALGDHFEADSAIAIGTHGQRVIRLASATDDSGMVAHDVAELKEFAAALALFLERFPEWRSYREKAQNQPLDRTKLIRSLPAIAEIEGDLIDRAGIDPQVPGRLKDLRQLANEDPDDPIAAHGALDSFRNVVGALADLVVTGAKKSGRGLLWFVKTASSRTAEKAIDALHLAAIDILLTKGTVLKLIAGNFPEHFGWLSALLSALGL